MYPTPFFSNPLYDVLLCERDRIRRMADLYKAAALQSFNRQKVGITYQSANDILCLKAGIIAAGPVSIMCDSGESISVKSICQVHFFATG